MSERSRFLVLAVLLSACAQAPFDSQPMPQVELGRYMGKWYEIARYPNHFEKGCEGVTAEYARNKDGSVSVLNTCRERGPSGKTRTAAARAWSEDPTNSRFQVSFFRPFTAPYWVVALDSEYRWALVGHPRRKYFWILSRTPTLEPETEAIIMAEAARLGYDAARLERTVP